MSLLVRKGFFNIFSHKIEEKKETIVTQVIVAELQRIQGIDSVIYISREDDNK
jgi:cell division protein FtsX